MNDISLCENELLRHSSNLPGVGVVGAWVVVAERKQVSWKRV